MAAILFLIDFVHSPAVQQSCSATQKKSFLFSNSLSLKRGLLKEFLFIFSTFRHEAKHPPSATALFLKQDNFVLQGVAVESPQHHFLSLYFRGGSFPFLARSVKKVVDHIVHLGMWPKNYPHSTVYSLTETASFLLSVAVAGVKPLFVSLFLGGRANPSPVRLCKASFFSFLYI